MTAVGTYRSNNGQQKQVCCQTVTRPTEELPSSSQNDPERESAMDFPSGITIQLADWVSGLAGNDSIDGGGNDTLIGNADNDTIHGGIGNDRIERRDGNDRLFGDP